MQYLKNTSACCWIAQRGRDFNRSQFFIILLSVLSFWYAGKFDIAVFVVALLLVVRYLVANFGEDFEVRPLLFSSLAYCLWIIISAAAHYGALRCLNPFTYITVKPFGVTWGLHTLKTATITYLLFPLLLIISIDFFRKTKDSQRCFLWVPLTALPSIGVAFYQGLIDIRFLNSAGAAAAHRVSGLVADFNGFGISMFLMLPMCVLSIIASMTRWGKAVFSILTIMGAGALLLSGSRTGFIGIAAFSVALPFIGVWVAPSRKKKRMLIYILVTLSVFFCLNLSSSLILKHTPLSATTLGRRLISSYHTLQDGGLNKLEPKRFELWLQAIRLTISAPLSGKGPGGFWRSVDNVRYENGQRFDYIDNATNQYLQMSSEFGIFGALLNTFLHTLPLWMIFCIRKKIGDIRTRWAVGISFSVVCIMLVLYLTGPHTMNVDVLWLLVIYLAYLAAVAMRHGYNSNTLNYPKFKVMLLCYSVLSIAFLVGTYNNSFGEKGYRALQQTDWWPWQNQYGYHYPYENWQNEKMIWTMKESSTHTIATSNMFGIKIVASPHNSAGADGLKLKMFLNGMDLDEIHFFNGGIKPVYYYFPNIRNEEIEIRTEVSNTFNPSRMGLSNDSRDLGVAVSPIVFLNIMPKEGIGFYARENWEEGKVPGWRDELPQIFRWTGVQASINLHNEFRDGGTLFLMCGHPGIDREPVKVIISCGNGLLRKQIMIDHEWKPVRIDGDEIKGQKMLTLRVDRTWNPRAAGISEDGRDLGVAVAVLERKPNADTTR